MRGEIEAAEVCNDVMGRKMLLRAAGQRGCCVLCCMLGPPH